MTSSQQFQTAISASLGLFIQRACPGAPADFEQDNLKNSLPLWIHHLVRKYTEGNPIIFIFISFSSVFVSGLDLAKPG